MICIEEISFYRKISVEAYKTSRINNNFNTMKLFLAMKELFIFYFIKQTLKANPKWFSIYIIAFETSFSKSITYHSYVNSKYIAFQKQNTIVDTKHGTTILKKYLMSLGNLQKQSLS